MKNSKSTLKISNKALAVMISAAAILIIIALSVTLYTQAKYEAYEVATYSMGSIVQQTVYGSDREDAAKEAANEIAVLEDGISWRKENSDVQNLNLTAGGEFLEINKNTYQLLTLAKDVSEISEGAFDITIAPLSQLWDFDSDKQKVPSTELIERLLPNVDYTNILLDEGKAVLKKSGTAIDLGAIGKGAACDIAIEAYKKHDVDRGIIAVGGSVGIYGNKPGGEKWHVAIKDPVESDGGSTLGELALEGGTFISTSGSYEKAFEQDGQLYHHILDPKTGYPAESDFVSVTVVTTSGALSDALSTACFVAGLNKSPLILAGYEGSVMGAVFVTGDKKVYVTRGLEESLKVEKEGYEVIVI